ncbi:MAG: sulfotransferase family 2 domain-containing protein [Bacteroidota bacterium]
MISHRHKCIFIHIPKTGGASVEHVIWPNKSDRTVENLWMGFVNKYENKYQTGGLQHLTANHIKMEVGEEIFKSYFKFSIVRNPWEKVISQYVYMKSKRKDLRKYLGMSRYTSLKKYLHLIQKKKHVQWMSQSDFLLDSNGYILADKIIRFENLNPESISIFNQLNIPNHQLPHINKSERRHYTSYYNDLTKEMVADIYKKDIDLFKYTFES